MIVWILDVRCDDAFIAYRYAHRLAQRGELAFNDGERVEGFSSPLYAIILSIGELLGVAPEKLSPIIGVSASTASVALVYHIGTFDRNEARYTNLLPCALLAIMFTYSSHAADGLETSLFSCATLISFAHLVAKRRSLERRDAVVSGVLFSLSWALRPEGIFAFIASLIIAFQRRVRVTAYATIVGSGLILRYAFYLDIFPNTARAKMPAYATELLTHGLHYLSFFADDFGLFAFVFCALVAIFGLSIALARRSFESRFAWVCLAFVYCFLHAMFVVCVGGDFQDGHRFLHVIIAPLFCGFAASGSLVCEYLYDRGRMAARLGMLAILGGSIAYGAKQFSLVRSAAINEMDTRASRRVMTLEALRTQVDRDTALAGYLAERLAPTDWIATQASGVVPYLTDAPTIDAFGLSDRFVALHGVRVPGLIGHRRAAPLWYLASRRPTVLAIDLMRPSYRPISIHDAPRAPFTEYQWIVASLVVHGPSGPYEYYVPLLVREDRVGAFEAVQPEIAR
ncbi:MAG: hypothetical protein H6726_19170 [Sandaracinaceae bacterium]|nr:hypothetical protein [Sandaracinaceae bacterium]